MRHRSSVCQILGFAPTVLTPPSPFSLVAYVNFFLLSPTSLLSYLNIRIIFQVQFLLALSHSVVPFFLPSWLDDLQICVQLRPLIGPDCFSFSFDGWHTNGKSSEYRRRGLKAPKPLSDALEGMNITITSRRPLTEKSRQPRVV